MADGIGSRRKFFAVLAFLGIALVVVIAVRAGRSAGMPPAVKTALGPARARPKLVFGSNIAIFLAPDGSLWAWGDDRFARLLSGNQPKRYAVPQILGTNSDWIDVAIRYQEFAGVRSDGTLWAWGPNYKGSSPDRPTQVNPDEVWQSVAAGMNHTLALEKDGTLWAWGRNKMGQLGEGTTADREKPMPVDTNFKWSAIGAGADASLALRTDGTLWGWGRQDMAQPETSAVVDTTRPRQIGTDTNWVEIAACDFLAAGRKSDHSIWVWGSNAGAMMQRSEFRPRGGGLLRVGKDWDWKMVAVGFIQGLALEPNGTLWGWGGSPRDAVATGGPIPKQLSSRRDWISVWTAQENGGGLTSDGKLWLWGVCVGEQPMIPLIDQVARGMGDFLRSRGVNTTWGRSQRFVYRHSSIPWSVLEFTNMPPTQPAGANLGTGTAGQSPFR